MKEDGALIVVPIFAVVVWVALYHNITNALGFGAIVLVVMCFARMFM